MSNDRFWRHQNWAKEGTGYVRPPVKLGAVLAIKLNKDQWDQFGRMALQNGFRLRTDYLKFLAESVTRAPAKTGYLKQSLYHQLHLLISTSTQLSLFNDVEYAKWPIN